MKKSLKMFSFTAALAVPAIVLAAVSSPSLPSAASAEFPLLKKIIVAYNVKHHKKSLADGSYRGEEGILRITPYGGRSLGLNVLIDQDYLEAKAMYKKARGFYSMTVRSMRARDREIVSGSHVKRILENAVNYNVALATARERMTAYSAGLTPENDERLKKSLCSDLMEKLLDESLKKASYNLRDAMGYFFNRCRGSGENIQPLNSKNVRFVNHVFREFRLNASKKALSLFDLDKFNKNDGADLVPGWKNALGRDASYYIPYIEPLIRENEKAGYPMDLFLFLALMRQESNFNPVDVSQVGAAGLTQIMPKTAMDLGMKNIFMPSYFEEAGTLMARERQLRRKAVSLIRRIGAESSLKLAKRARDTMQESIACKRKRIKFFARYRRELVKEGNDERLIPEKAIRYGFKYFSRMMQIQQGDVSLALACYNAGPHRVKQFNGIPPYRETVTFRNRVLKYYRDYLGRIKRFRADQN